MGIHVHVKGKPDMCRCCAIVDRLNELWDRTHNSVLSVNGIYADGNGNVLIQGIQDISELREQVQTDRAYLEAVAEDVAEIGTIVPSLATLNTEQTFTAAKYLSRIGANATAIVNKDWIWNVNADAENNLMHRTTNESVSGKKYHLDGLWASRPHSSDDMTTIVNDMVYKGENAAGTHAIRWLDRNGRSIGAIFLSTYADGHTTLYAELPKSDGTNQYFPLAVTQ